jgi:hypothetical protein
MQQQFSETISQAGANVKRTAPVKPVFRVTSDWYDLGLGLFEAGAEPLGSSFTRSI